MSYRNEANLFCSIQLYISFLFLENLSAKKLKWSNQKRVVINNPGDNGFSIIGQKIALKTIIQKIYLKTKA